jgi:alpha-pyrone synthase
MVAIAAIGTANPAFKNHQANTAELISAGLDLKPAEKRLLKSVYKATGIEYRYSVLGDYCKQAGDFEFFPNDSQQPFPSTAERMRIYKENALKLALESINNCLSQLPHFDKTTITHLITVSCTGMYAPGMDIEIVQQLHLPSTTNRTAINFMGCYGAFNGLKVANAICQSDPNANVLVVCVELCTIHFQKKMSMDNIISNAIFSDGAAAVLIRHPAKMNKYFSLEAFHCDLLPQTSQAMAWQIADSGFDIVLSSYVPEAIQKGIATFTHRLLDKHQLSLSAIDYYAIHPGGIKILQACEASLAINEQDNKYAYHVLRHFGNMSSATILFVLKAIWDDVHQHDHDKTIFSCAFGPGLTLESMLLKTYCR